MRSLAQAAPLSTALELIGGSPAAERLRAAVVRAANTVEPVLISAEPGLDSAAVARAIHDGGSRAPQPFVTIQCGSHDPSALETEIFRRTDSGGTMLLANLEKMPAQVQSRLARTLRDGPIVIDQGGRESAFDMRVLATVPGHLDEEIQQGTLLRELCGRFGLRLELPPLRRRAVDIPMLIGCLVGDAATDSRVPVPSFSREALTLLSALPWLRNLDELREVMGALVLAAGGGTVQLEDVLGQVPVQPVTTSQAGTASLREARMSFERQYIASVLHRHRGRMEEAARSLGIQRTNLYRKVRQLGIGLARVK